MATAFCISFFFRINMGLVNDFWSKVNVFVRLTSRLFSSHESARGLGITKRFLMIVVCALYSY